MNDKIITEIDELSESALRELSNGYGDSNLDEEFVAGVTATSIQTFTNSPLVNYTKISPNKTIGRNHIIDTITIHCVEGQCTVQTLGDIFYPASRKASSNYGIGYDGKIGLYCDEKDRSWCSSSASNDHRAITIEVASDTKEPYAVKDAAYNSLIKLVTDICKRNNIKKLLWVNDKSLIGNIEKQNMTIHRWFADTSCPGSYLLNKMGDIASKVNANLSAALQGTEYKLVTKVNKYVSAADAKAKKNSKGTYSAGTYYIYRNYPNGYDGMYNITTDKTGNSAGSWINPSENIIQTTPPAPSTAKTYTLVTTCRIYTTAANAKSKINSVGTWKAGTYYIYNKYLNGYNGMYALSLAKDGSSPDAWINPTENVKSSTPTITSNEYKVVTRIRIYTTAANAKAKKNSVGTWKPGTYYIYNKYPNGYDGMYALSLAKNGSSPDAWINPSENVVAAALSVDTINETKKISVIRKIVNEIIKLFKK